MGVDARPCQPGPPSDKPVELCLPIQLRLTRLVPGMGAQVGLKQPLQRHNNRRNNGLPKMPRAQEMRPAKVAWPGSPNGAIEVQFCEMFGCLSIASRACD
jgi:hypothetical protein